MNDFKGQPAKFLLNNSKGRPDFLMTMLTIVTIAMLIVLLFWMALNLIAFRTTLTKEAIAANENNKTEESFIPQLILLVSDFNSNTRLIILGLASSVFSLAGAYYLRRKNYDEHYLKNEKSKLFMGFKENGETPSFVPADKSTIDHPNYDDESEDI